MKWIMREHAKVDRIACPWLIKNFVDKDAEFFFVHTDKVKEFAKQQNVIPFDVPNVELGHQGEQCSFDAIIKKYELDKSNNVTDIPSPYMTSILFILNDSILM